MNTSDTAIGRRHAAMLAAADEPFGTRWRCWPLVAAGIASLFALYQLVAAGALAVNFTTSDDDFVLYTNYMEGDSSAIMLSRNTSHSGAADDGVSEIGIKEARLAGLCMISTSPVTGFGNVTMVIVAGVPVKSSFNNAALALTDGNGVPITVNATGDLSGASLTDSIKVTDLFINSNRLSGYGNKLGGLDLGKDASTVISDANVNGGAWLPGQAPPTAGGFGLTADDLNVADFDGSTYGMNLHGSVLLPKVKIRPKIGAVSQSSCPVEANG